MVKSSAFMVTVSHIFLPSMQRKNGQINALMKNHEKAFSDIKNYYNDITLNNLALINSLKVQQPSPSLEPRSVASFPGPCFIQLHNV